ncbi:unnamed protein product [Urochloa humidicola]
MGNMLPCLVQGSSSILPPMNTKHWSRSMKILVKTLRRSAKRPHFSISRTKAAARTSGENYPAAPRTGRRGPRSGGGQNDRRRSAVRVKVLLTRAEAARLLSLTADGHRTAAQVVGELERMQAAKTMTRSSRASTAHVISELKRMEELVVARASTSPSASTTPWRPVLDSIPEEWQ